MIELPKGAPVPLDFSVVGYATWVARRTPRLKVHAKIGHARGAITQGSRWKCDMVLYSLSEKGWTVSQIWRDGVLAWEGSDV